MPTNPYIKEMPSTLTKINILVKSKDNYENNISLMKLILNERLNIKNSKPSNLKLIVSLERLTANLGVNKDIYSFGRMLTFNVKYSFYDKKGLLKSEIYKVKVHLMLVAIHMEIKCLKKMLHKK